MKIREIYIQSFGALRDRSFRFDEGVNILEGPNESGKTTVAAFIKYIFYGPDQKGSMDRARYLTGVKSGGWLTFDSDAGVTWRIERTTMLEREGSRESIRDSVQIIDTRTSQVLPEKHPGEYFFGVNESVFVNTAFVGQMSAVRPDGSSLAGAVENMLHAADENVDLKRAADRLNQARRELLPKNSPGGKIREKEEEKAGLEEALAAAAERSARIRETESALQTASRKRQELEEKKDQLEQVMEAAEVIGLCRKLAAAEDTAGKLKSYRNALDVLTAPPFGDLQEKLDAITEDGEPEEEPVRQTAGSHLKLRNEDAAAALEEGEYLESKARLFLAVAITMVIAGLAALAAGAIMVYFGFPAGQFAIPFGAMGVFVIIGIVFYVLQGKNISRLNEILDEWDVDSLDELDELAENGDTARRPAAPVQKGRAPLEDPAVIAQLQALASACGVAAEEDPAAMLAALRKKAEKAAADRETVRSKVEQLTGRLGALQEAVTGLDRTQLVTRYKQIMATPAGKAAGQLDQAALAKMQKEREFTIGAWRAQSKKEAELEQVLASCTGGDNRTPDILAGQLDRAAAELAELEKQHAAYSMALEALQSAGQSLRTTVIPAITERASAAMKAATGGKYDRIAMDPSFGLRFTGRDGSDTVDVLSKGTSDLAYVSLRLALAGTLYGENGREVPPVILDETFAAVDCGRLEMALDAMRSAGVQCILFTCRGDEGRIGRERGCSVTKMA